MADTAHHNDYRGVISSKIDPLRTFLALLPQGLAGRSILPRGSACRCRTFHLRRKAVVQRGAHRPSARLCPPLPPSTECSRVVSRTWARGCRRQAQLGPAPPPSRHLYLPARRCRFSHRLGDSSQYVRPSCKISTIKTLCSSKMSLIRLTRPIHPSGDETKPFHAPAKMQTHTCAPIGSSDSSSPSSLLVASSRFTCTTQSQFAAVREQGLRSQRCLDIFCCRPDVLPPGCIGVPQEAGRLGRNIWAVHGEVPRLR